MKLFRKKKDSNDKQTRGAETVAPLPVGPLRFSGTTVKKDVPAKVRAPVRSKEDAQRRFVNKLYQLSYAHGGNSVTTPPDLVKSESSSPGGTSSPTEPCSITPDSSPVGAKPVSATLMVKSATKDDEAGVMETIDAVFTQITACTSDFFGDGVAAECVNAQGMRHDGTPRTIAIQYPPVPNTITFESAVVATTPPRKKPRETLLRPSILVDKSIVEGVNELDDIVERVERSAKKSSIAYEPPKSENPGQSLIDNVWVVSSFPPEEKQQPLPAATEELSVTSSIPTRLSHRL